jgi:hypothetical protein
MSRIRSYAGFNAPSKFTPQDTGGKSKKPMAHRHERRKVREYLKYSSSSEFDE